MHQQWVYNRYVLAEFPLPEVYRLIWAKINIQPFCLIDRKTVKTTENALTMEDVPEETQLLSDLLWEVLVPTSRDQMTVFRVRSLRYIKGFHDT